MFKVAPLKGSFMVLSMAGFFVSVLLIYPAAQSWGIAFGITFAAMFIASLISMTFAPIQEAVPRDLKRRSAGAHVGREYTHEESLADAQRASASALTKNKAGQKKAAVRKKVSSKKRAAKKKTTKKAAGKSSKKQSTKSAKKSSSKSKAKKKTEVKSKRKSAKRR